MPEAPQDAGLSGVRMKVAHVQSLGLVGAVLALLTMCAALSIAVLMLFGRSILAAVVVVVLWPYVFSPEFTRWVFGVEYAPFWRVFLMMVILGTLARMFWSTSWGHK